MPITYESKSSTSYYKVPSPIHERLFSEPLVRHLHLTGAVRTGKTHGCCVRFIQEVYRQHHAEPHITKTFCIIAKSRHSLMYNILNNLYDWLPNEIAKLFPITQNAHGVKLFDGKVFIRYFPIDDERSVGRLMGSSLQGIWIDEVSYMSLSTYAKVSSRLTGKLGSKFEPFIITTSNPDSVSHWLNQTTI